MQVFKGFLGTNNTDSNSRLCMAAAVVGYRSSLGSDGPPVCYDDIDLADVIFIIGSNPAEAHPVIFDRVRAAKKKRPELLIVVADPRRTLSAQEADLYLPVVPGGDIALLNALGKLLLDLEAVDDVFVAAHTNGFAEYQQFLRNLDLADLCRVAGVERALLTTVAPRMARSGVFELLLHGLEPKHGRHWKNNSLINLHLLTGQIGKPGAGPFSLTGQPNAMGGREPACCHSNCPAIASWKSAAPPGTGGDLAAAGHFAANDPGLTAVEMFRALEKGKIKAMWIAATNPMVSLPDLHQAQRGLEKAELLIVSGRLPPDGNDADGRRTVAAAQWGEKEWTSTNSERLVSYSPEAVQPAWRGPARLANPARLGRPGLCPASTSRTPRRSGRNFGC